MQKAPKWHGPFIPEQMLDTHPTMKTIVNDICAGFVSALQNRVSPRQKPVLVETWFEC